MKTEELLKKVEVTYDKAIVVGAYDVGLRALEFMHLLQKEIKFETEILNK